MKVNIDEIIQKAFRFECCPHCGKQNLESNHYCNCEEGQKGFTGPDDAYWFSQFLIKEYGLKDYPCYIK